MIDILRITSEIAFGGYDRTSEMISQVGFRRLLDAVSNKQLPGPVLTEFCVTIKLD